MQIAERLYSLAQEQNDAGLMLGAYRALSSRSTIWAISRPRDNTRYVVFRSGVQETFIRHAEDLFAPVIGCLCYGGLSEWHLGEIASCQAHLEEAISIAKELNDKNALAFALAWAAAFATLSVILLKWTAWHRI